MSLHAPGKGRRGKPDPQAKKLYEWQWLWRGWNEQACSLKDCKAAIDAACDLWCVPRVPVGQQPERKDYSIYDDRNRSIKLLACHQNLPMALHEVSHHIVDVAYGSAFHDHGPVFVGVFADLLIATGVAPADAILGSLKARKIKYKLPKTVKRKRP